MIMYDLIVGTFNTPSLYTLSFSPPTRSANSSLKILKRHDAIGSHSWLALSPSKRNLYATAWLDPPCVASYTISASADVQVQNTAPTQSRSGYVCASATHVYSAGGATGEAFALDPSTGAFSSATNHHDTATDGDHKGSSPPVQPSQRLSFVSDQAQKDDGSTMDFGGLRHGAHSADMSPSGDTLYIADIGRNCIWVYSVAPTDGQLSLLEKHISPRPHDGPRHVWPHPNGHVVYTLQEHSSMVDVFSVEIDGKLKHVQGVRIIPTGLPVDEFWADEVRTSSSSSVSDSPRYLYASTRGLKNGRKGYVAVYKLLPSGLIDGASLTRHGSAEAMQDSDQGGLLCMYETATGGGWANAIQPGPTVEGFEYLALTDSEVGFVYVLSWDGQQVRETARVDLNQDKGAGVQEDTVVGAATAVWLD